MASVGRAFGTAVFGIGALYSVITLIQGSGYPLIAEHYLFPFADGWSPYHQFLFDSFLNLVLCGGLAFLIAPKRRLKASE
jgi:hypothetical protein